MKFRLFSLLTLLISINTFGQLGFQEHVIIDDTYSVLIPIHVAPQDVDNDGDMDIISVSKDDKKIAWYENIDGQGNYGFQQIIAIDSNSILCAYSGDIDGDGDVDIVFATAINGKLGWYENLDGLGNFSDEKIIGLDLSGPISIFAEDMDGDGDKDIITNELNDSKIIWFENMDGLGNFGSEKIITNVADPENQIFINDIDGDGDQDVLCSSKSTDRIVWYENIDNQGSFGLEQIITNNLNGVWSIFSGDIDGDGDQDILAAAALADKIVWYKNINGQGNAWAEEVITSDQNGPNFAFLSDLDGDGDMDVISASSIEDKTMWYENIDGLGSFSSGNLVLESSDLQTSGFASDMDGDGDMDLLVSGSEILWYKNIDGQGNFEAQIGLLYKAQEPVSIFTSDLDGDGDLDVLSASKEDDKIAWFENMDGQGTFGLQQIITLETDNPWAVTAADLDGDGDMDVISASAYDGKIAWYENINGLGEFGPQQIITIVDFVPCIFAVDLDNDGDMDILYSSAGASEITWFENIDGQGNFVGKPHVAEFSDVDEPWSIFTSDIDNDGDLDILSASKNDDKIAWYENTDGLGNFGSQQIISTDVSVAVGVYAADLDGDGDMDVISASQGNGEISWFKNTDGQGSFSTKQVISPSSYAASLVFASDVDGDGDMDVVSSSFFGWFENTDGLGNFSERQPFSLTANAWFSATSADIDNDGDMDMISAIFGLNKVAWYENLGLVSNQIKGTIRSDVNSNGCDANDALVPNVKIRTSDGTKNITSFSLSNGFYQFFPSEGTYTTTIFAPDFYNANPIEQVSDFVGFSNTDIVDFCLEPDQTVNDLNITLFPLSDARPGFDASYQLIYHNVGTTQLSGSVSLEFDEAKLDFLNASESVSSQNNNVLTFDFENLNPFETRTIDLNFNVSPPPTVNIDDVLIFTSTINPIIGDFSEDDNIFTFEQTVIGSYDPNDIRVLEGEQILIEEANDYLHYIIRFQNTGTAEAINVRVENKLDDNLQWSSIQLENFSHNNRVEIIDGNEVAFIFDNINLPDSTTNESASHGFIAYKIKPKSNIAIGDIISNTADIYFDFNPAIVTNTVMTEIVEPTSINEKTTLNFSLFPNPTSKTLMILTQSRVDQIEIYDQLGQLLLTKFNENQIDISNLNRGIYFCKVKDDKGNSRIKKVVKN